MTRTTGARLVHEGLEASARRAPRAIALVCGARRVGYAELDREADRLASALCSVGVRRGDRVVVHLDNSAEAAIAVFGVLKAGGVFSLVGAPRAEALAFIIRDTGARVLITSGDRGRRTVLAAVLPSLPAVTIVSVGGGTLGDLDGCGAHHFVSWDDLLAASTGVRPEASVIDVDLGTLIYTSGTTGRPKGVMSAHADMMFAARAMIEYLESDASDVVLSVLPLSHTYGLYQLITSVLAGGTLVLERNFLFPAQTLETIAAEGVTGLPGVPTMFAVLLRQDLVRYDLASLRYLSNAAAALPVEHVSALRSALPSVRIFAMYGQTECKRACYLPPEEIERRPGSVGVPLPGTEAYVADEAGNRVPPGAVGELVLRGSHLMRGYWGRPDETAVRLRRGHDGDLRLHTGDLFRSDADGYLYFVSRSDDIIKSRGEKVSPLQIEDVLRSLPGVGGVAAVGVPDDLLGEAVKVVVVPDGSVELTERTVRAYCAARLEDFMVPRQVEFRSALPTNTNGKVLRRELRPCVA